MDQVPDIQMEVEPPAPRVTAPEKPPTARKPRGTALMDAPGWSNVDEGNIIKPNNEGRSTRSNTGNAMHAESTDQDKMRAGLDLLTSMFQRVVESATMNTLKKSGILDKMNDSKDEEEDNQNSIGANSAKRENNANKE